MCKFLFFLVSLLTGVSLWAERSWQPTIEPRGITNGYRQGVGGELVLPISQNPCSLLFGQALGGRFQNEWVASLGVGYRRLAPSSCWAWGVNGFVDGALADRKSYYQGGLGLELFGRCWTARINGYLPSCRTNDVATHSTSSLVLGGTSLFSQSSGYCLRERTYPGYDAEVGAGFDICGGSLWGYGGYYHFTRTGLETIRGPRIRLIYSYDVCVAGLVAQLKVGALYEQDRVYGHRVGAEIGIRIPLGPLAKATCCPPSSLLRRMGERVVRQEGILRGCERCELPVSEGAVLHSNGGPRHVIFVHGGGVGEGTQHNPTHLDDALAIAQPGDTLVLSRQSGDISVKRVTLPPDVALIGFGEEGEAFVYAGGASYRLTDPYGRVALIGTSRDPILELATGSSVSGIGLENGRVGISGQDLKNARVTDVQIKGCKEGGIRLEDATNVVVDSLVASDIEGPLVTGERVSHFRLANLATNNYRQSFYGLGPEWHDLTGIKMVHSSNLVLENLNLDGDYGIQLEKSADALIRHATISGTHRLLVPAGINLCGTDRVLIDDLSIKGSFTTAITIVQADRTDIRRLDAQTDAHDVLHVEKAKDFSLIESTLSGAQRSLVYLDQVSGNLCLVDNVFEGARDAKRFAVNVLVKQSDPVSLNFTRNAIRSCRGGGLWVEMKSHAPTEVMFAQNTLTDLGGEGLLCCQKTSDINFTVHALNNTIARAGGGIVLKGCVHGFWPTTGTFKYLIDENRIADISNNGIDIYDSAYSKVPSLIDGTISNNYFSNIGKVGIKYNRRAADFSSHQAFSLIIQGNHIHGAVREAVLIEAGQVYAFGDADIKLLGNHDFGTRIDAPYAIKVLAEGLISVEIDGNVSDRAGAKIHLKDFEDSLEIAERESLSQRNGGIDLKVENHYLDSWFDRFMDHLPPYYKDPKKRTCSRGMATPLEAEAP